LPLKTLTGWIVTVWAVSIIFKFGPSAY
jgi:hypothetical protein